MAERPCVFDSTPLFAYHNRPMTGYDTHNRAPPKGAEKNPRYAGVNMAVWRRHGRRTALLLSTDERVSEKETARAHKDLQKYWKMEARLIVAAVRSARAAALKRLHCSPRL